MFDKYRAERSQLKTEHKETFRGHRTMSTGAPIKPPFLNKNIRKDIDRFKKNDADARKIIAELESLNEENLESLELTWSSSGDLQMITNGNGTFSDVFKLTQAGIEKVRKAS